MERMGKQKGTSYKTGEFAFTETEVTQLLLSTEDFRNYVFLKTAIASGIRRGDIVALQWSGVDFDHGAITYWQNKKRRSHTCYVSPAVMQDLKRLRSISNNNHYVFDGGSEKKYGQGHISSRSAYDVLQRSCKKAGLKGRPFHALRATCIKLCQKRGWSAAQTAKHVDDTIRVIQVHYEAPSVGEREQVAKDKAIV